MEKYSIIYGSPAIVALLIFMYMRNRQAARNDKRRERFWKREEELMNTLRSDKKVDRPKNEDSADPS